MRPVSLLLAVLLAVGLLGTDRAGADVADERPNLLLILVDDLRWDVLGHAGHPFVETPHIDRLAAEGARFTNAFVTTSLCSPSRATIYTGRYAHGHGVFTNESAVSALDPGAPTFAGLLRAAGYRTAFVGKWHLKPVERLAEDFDHYFTFRGQGVYADPLFLRNGTRVRASGYMTDLLTEEAVSFLETPSKEKPEAPFCLIVSHKAVHVPFEPAERHRGRYRAQEPTPPPGAADDLAQKPAALRRAALHGYASDRFEASLSEPVPERLPDVA